MRYAGRVLQALRRLNVYGEGEVADCSCRRADENAPPRGRGESLRGHMKSTLMKIRELPAPEKWDELARAIDALSERMGWTLDDEVALLDVRSLAERLGATRDSLLHRLTRAGIPTLSLGDSVWVRKPQWLEFLRRSEAVGKEKRRKAA
jgi:hypothetical protein